MENKLNLEIKDLWLTGKSAAEIAKLLKVTRGAVMGRIHRMRANNQIGIRECDERMRSIRAEVKKLERERVVTLFDILKESPLENDDTIKEVMPIFEEEKPKPTNKPVKLMDLTYRSCRFVINDGDPSTFLFCGKEKKGRSYCEEHEAICYYKLERRKKPNVFTTRR